LMAFSDLVRSSAACCDSGGGATKARPRASDARQLGKRPGGEHSHQQHFLAGRALETDAQPRNGLMAVEAQRHAFNAVADADAIILVIRVTVLDLRKCSAADPLFNAGAQTISVARGGCRD